MEEAVALFTDYSPNMDQDSRAVISTECQQIARIPTLSQDALSHLGSTLSLSSLYQEVLVRIAEHL